LGLKGLVVVVVVVALIREGKLNEILKYLQLFPALPLHQGSLLHYPLAMIQTWT
jgi:hypothetical protein